MGLRSTQLGLLVTGILTVVDIFYDARVFLDFLDTDMVLLCVVHVLVMAAASILQAIYLVGRRPLLRFALVALRLSVFPEIIELLSRPNYQTLHPLFASPLFLCLTAVLKAIPTCLLQTFVHLRNGGYLPDPFDLLRLCTMMAWAVAAYEVGDFKQKQVLSPAPYASGRFISLLLFRFCEILGRITAISWVLAVSPTGCVLWLSIDMAILMLWQRPVKIPMLNDGRSSTVLTLTGVRPPDARRIDLDRVPTWAFAGVTFIYWDLHIDCRWTMWLPVMRVVPFRAVQQLIVCALAAVGFLGCPDLHPPMLLLLTASLGALALFPWTCSYHWTEKRSIFRPPAPPRRPSIPVSPDALPLGERANAPSHALARALSSPMERSRPRHGTVEDSRHATMTVRRGLFGTPDSRPPAPYRTPFLRQSAAQTRSPPRSPGAPTPAASRPRISPWKLAALQRDLLGAAAFRARQSSLHT